MSMCIKNMIAKTCLFGGKWLVIAAPWFISRSLFCLKKNNYKKWL